MTKHFSKFTQLASGIRKVTAPIGVLTNKLAILELLPTLHSPTFAVFFLHFCHVMLVNVKSENNRNERIKQSAPNLSGLNPERDKRHIACVPGCL